MRAAENQAEEALARSGSPARGADPAPPARESQPLPSPAALRARLPVSATLTRQIAHRRRQIADVIHGRDARRLIAVVGPCSLHDRDAMLDYGRKLADVARRRERELVVVMRAYFEKPRTRLGWKGVLRDPALDGVGDPARGIETARRWLRELGALGLACGSELLDPVAAPYLEDLLSWAAIGARTSASPVHRELASGLPCPTGFKNPPDGCLDTPFDAVAVAREPHDRLGVGDDGSAAVIRTRGNPDGHVVLRGGVRPNHDAASLGRVVPLAARAGLARPVLIDCSHANSGKDHRLQATVCRSVLEQVRAGAGPIAGLMLESHLEAGRQQHEPETALTYGLSITDACIGWKETELLLEEAAEAVRARA